MFVLGIETATPVCGVALVDDGNLIIEYRAAIKNAHGRLLAGAIQTVLRDAGLAVKDLQGIAVSIGPGSFTGLRIGLAMAKGLAIATGMPIAAVDTLKALATQAPILQGDIVPLLRSRANEFYAALYHRQNGIDTLGKGTEVIQWDAIPSLMPKGALLIGHFGQHTPPPEYQVASISFAHLSGYTVARLGWEQLQAGLAVTGDLLEPSYLQEFQVGKPKSSILAV